MKVRGVQRVSLHGWLVGAAYNLVRMGRLATAPPGLKGAPLGARCGAVCPETARAAEKRCPRAKNSGAATQKPKINLK